MSESIQQILAILTRTGFADLAAELRRLIEAGKPDQERPGDAWIQGSEAFEAPDPSFQAYTHEEQAQLVVDALGSQLVDPAVQVAEAEDLAGQLMNRSVLPILLVETAFGEPRYTPATDAMGFEAAERLRALIPALLKAILADATDSGR
ncbi:MAG: hypothetical protein LW852_11545 [Sediminibacterium sp.]|nr:hypothetical protein [Sediminibacterium sp.]